VTGIPTFISRPPALRHPRTARTHQRDLSPLDDRRLAPSVAWLLGGIPQMQPHLAEHLSAPVALHLTGPGAQAVLITAGEDSADAATIVVRPNPASRAGAATAVSTTADFLGWSTTRTPWRDTVTVTGDYAAAENFLDALNLI
jgi:hypothetical protein